ncbi:beta-1,3-galactosyltransferase 1 [Patella vulgata]|uniref:beta-1,3-galactosyltransferase 1 n=1 Tax=Patella vulgata TaxID=6465 RepID=UPI0024AA013E|nr:beta-1,3-galactosyltransferase 1 [Patella vulgata]XP_055957940.1 beta-1,3-galactosyltransferase 1 [Patella vulgata]
MRPKRLCAILYYTGAIFMIYQIISYIHMWQAVQPIHQSFNELFKKEILHKYDLSNVATDEEMKKVLNLILLKYALDSKSKNDSRNVHPVLNPVINDKTVNPVINGANPIFNGDYLLNNMGVCPDNLTIIVVVHTAPDHFIRRQNIRTTYGSSTMFLPVNIRTVFLIGRVKTAEKQAVIISEYSRYGDIIQGNFIDAYHNLTYKAVMGLHWVSHYCSQAKYVVKVDDDLVFDMWRFLNMFHARNHFISKSIYCYVRVKGKIHRKGKWEVPKEMFNGYASYPFQHCIGFTVIYSGDIIPALYRASYKVPFFWLDDVYVTGMLRIAVDGIHLNQHTQDNLLRPTLGGLKCLQEQGRNCTYLSMGATEGTFNATWLAIKRRSHNSLKKT